MATRAELVERFLPHSPFVEHLGIELAELDQDRVELLLPFSAELATMGDVIHGGAIATLIDTAGMAAAWADGTEVAEPRGGATIGLSIDFVAAARGEDLTARARVIRRGGRLCFCDADVVAESGEVLAKGLVTHRFA